MPDKNIDKTIVVVTLILAMLGGLANALKDEENCEKPSGKRIIFKTIAGGVAGILFAFLVCYMLGENTYLVGFSAGSGAILGLEGIRRIANVFRSFIEFNINSKR